MSAPRISGVHLEFHECTWNIMSPPGIFQVAWYSRGYIQGGCTRLILPHLINSFDKSREIQTKDLGYELLLSMKLPRDYKIKPGQVDVKWLEVLCTSKILSQLLWNPPACKKLEWTKTKQWENSTSFPQHYRISKRRPKHYTVHK